jgi:endo-1,3(4)-beta-glucanase
MLAVQARSFNNYFYLQNNNTNHPARFIQNKVTGILFENKVDYTSTGSPSTHLPQHVLAPPFPGALMRTTALPSVHKLQKSSPIDFPVLYTINLC